LAAPVTATDVNSLKPKKTTLKGPFSKIAEYYESIPGGD